MSFFRLIHLLIFNLIALLPLYAQADGFSLHISEQQLRQRVVDTFSFSSGGDLLQYRRAATVKGQRIVTKYHSLPSENVLQRDSVFLISAAGESGLIQTYTVIRKGSDLTSTLQDGAGRILEHRKYELGTDDLPLFLTVTKLNMSEREAITESISIYNFEWDGNKANVIDATSKKRAFRLKIEKDGSAIIMDCAPVPVKNIHYRYRKDGRFDQILNMRGRRRRVVYSKKTPLLRGINIASGDPGRIAGTGSMSTWKVENINEIESSLDEKVAHKATSEYIEERLLKTTTYRLLFPLTR